MYPLRYHRPATLAEAISLFAADARFLSGGQTLIPMLKQRLASPSDLIDISGLAELKGVTVDEHAVTIGATTTHAEVAHSQAVRAAIPALAALARSIGDPAVRHLGTLGGSLANNDPAADYPAAALALAATIYTDRRSIPADDFFQGLFATALEEDEIITRVVFPVPPWAGYRKFRNPASRYAMPGVFVARADDDAIRVAVTGAGNNGVFRATAIEDALAASWTPAAVEAAAVPEEDLLSDIHAGPAFRANLVRVMAKRALAGTAPGG
jgi:carbon-monoxide dehydrogenase medium subunit